MDMRVKPASRSTRPLGVHNSESRQAIREMDFILKGVRLPYHRHRTSLNCAWDGFIEPPYCQTLGPAPLLLLLVARQDSW